MHARRRRWSWCLAALAVLGFACSESTAPGDNGGLGKSAGTVKSADGLAELTVPAGALAENVTITITPTSDVPATPGLVAGTAYDFAPNGTQFSKPLALTITYDVTQIPAGGEAGALTLAHLVGGTWQPVSGSTVDTSAHTVRGSIQSFSIYAVLASSLGSKIVVTPAQSQLETEDTVALSAVVEDQNGTALTGRAITWRSADTTIATVAPTGQVIGHGVGQTTITAMNAGLSAAVPVQVTPRVANSLAAGDNFTCALDAAGAAFCWGTGTQGQLGNGAVASSSTPVRVAGAAAYRAISAGGETACGLRNDGTAECWGVAPGTCCILTTETVNAEPVAVPGSVRFESISVGLSMACGVATGGGGFCWGSNVNGELGIGAPDDTVLRPSPTAVVAGSQFVRIGAGVFGGCALRADGAAFCWGNNSSGQLGDGTQTFTDAVQPVAVSGGLAFRSLAVGAFYACGITTGGTAECWGAQLADGTEQPRAAPTPVAGNPSFTSIFGGSLNDIFAHTCATDAGGEASCWGFNESGELGTASADTCQSFAAPCSLHPVAVDGGLSFGAMAIGAEHTCGMTPDRSVYCWGANGFGQFGNGSTTDSNTPVLSGFTPAALVVRRGPRPLLAPTLRPVPRAAASRLGR